MKARTVIGTVLIILAAAFTIYLSVIMTARINAVVLKDTYKKIFRYELIACAFFLLFALDVRFNVTAHVKSGVLLAGAWILRVLVILVCAVLLFFMGKVTFGSLIRTEGNAAHAIVLGLALENGQPTEDLLSRVDTAYQYALDHPDATLILTGGVADDTGKTEAAVMQDLLRERGLPEERTVTEDRAENTKENFRNAARLINPEEPVVLISSSYHMDRAVGTARSAGFTDILRLPAPSSPIPFGANLMWEAMLEINEITLKQ